MREITSTVACLRSVRELAPTDVTRKFATLVMGNAWPASSRREERSSSSTCCRFSRVLIQGLDGFEATAGASKNEIVCMIPYLPASVLGFRPPPRMRGEWKQACLPLNSPLTSWPVGGKPIVNMRWTTAQPSRPADRVCQNLVGRAKINLTQQVKILIMASAT